MTFTLAPELAVDRPPGVALAGRRHGRRARAAAGRAAAPRAPKRRCPRPNPPAASPPRSRGRCTSGSGSIRPRRGRRRRRCCAACARATRCRASTRWWMSATGARSSSSCPTASTTPRSIEGDVELRLGAAGESYPGIRKDDVHVGGRITLADARGPFGNPTSDSARTMVTTATTRALLVVFAPRRSTAAAPSRCSTHGGAYGRVHRRDESVGSFWHGSCCFTAGGDMNEDELKGKVDQVKGRVEAGGRRHRRQRAAA